MRWRILANWRFLFGFVFQMVEKRKFVDVRVRGDGDGDESAFDSSDLAEAKVDGDNFDGRRFGAVGGRIDVERFCGGFL